MDPDDVRSSGSINIRVSTKSVRAASVVTGDLKGGVSSSPPPKANGIYVRSSRFSYISVYNKKDADCDHDSATY